MRPVRIVPHFWHLCRLGLQHFKVARSKLCVYDHLGSSCAPWFSCRTSASYILFVGALVGLFLYFLLFLKFILKDLSRSRIEPKVQNIITLKTFVFSLWLIREEFHKSADFKTRKHSNKVSSIAVPYIFVGGDDCLCDSARVHMCIMCLCYFLGYRGGIKRTYGSLPRGMREEGGKKPQNAFCDMKIWTHELSCDWQACQDKCWVNNYKTRVRVTFLINLWNPMNYWGLLQTVNSTECIRYLVFEAPPAYCSRKLYKAYYVNLVV